MSRFFIANIRIRDEITYRKYTEKAIEICHKYNGDYMVVDNEPVVVEGNWNYTRLVIIRFESRSDFNAWYNSEEYQEILKFRLEAADCDSILVRTP